MVWRSIRARNIYSSTDDGNGGHHTSEDSSEAEFVEEEKPWPPTVQRLSRSRGQKQVPRYPRPHSHLYITSGGRTRGGKHARRWENSMFLTSLYNIPEEDFEASSSITPSHNTPLSQLHNSDKHMQIWSSFTSSSEEEQQHTVARSSSSWRREYLHHEDHVNTLPDHLTQQEGGPPLTPQQSFKKIQSRIRTVLQHNRHLPLDLLSELEEELCYLFSVAPHAVVLVLQTNAFCRLLLHGISQYMSLKSTTEQVQGSSIIVVECGRRHFLPPTTPLSTYIRSRT